MSLSHYVTTPTRASLGLLAGAVTGGASWVLVVALPIIWSGGAAYLLLPMSLAVGVVASATYVVGLTLLGAPLWALLHRSRRRGALSATALGAGLNSLVVGVFVTFVVTADPRTLLLIPIAAGVGAFVGWVIWRIAYRRAA